MRGTGGMEETGATGGTHLQRLVLLLLVFKQLGARFMLLLLNRRSNLQLQPAERTRGYTSLIHR